MGVKYLSAEWCKAVEDRLNSDEGYQTAAKGQAAKLQNVITDTPEGEISYFFQIDDGKARLGVGEIDSPDTTIKEAYDTAVALNKRELNPQAAFMQGKLKVSGNMMKMMQLQGVITAMEKALADLDVDY